MQRAIRSGLIWNLDLLIKRLFFAHYFNNQKFLLQNKFEICIFGSQGHFE